MKYFHLLFFFFSFFLFNGQSITVLKMDENKRSEILLSDKTSIEVWFDYNTFDINSAEFTFKDLEIFQENKLGIYGDNEMRLNDDFRYKFKLKRKEKKVFVYDGNKKLVFEGNLVFTPKNASLLDRIEIVNDATDNILVESWISLATLNKLYGSQRKELFKMVLGSAVFGGVTGIASEISK